jgi:hypothetical protein
MVFALAVIGGTSSTFGLPSDGSCNIRIPYGIRISHDRSVDYWKGPDYSTGSHRPKERQNTYMSEVFVHHKTTTCTKEVVPLNERI